MSLRSVGGKAVDEPRPAASAQLLRRAALRCVCRVPRRPRIAAREAIVMTDRGAAGALARPVLAGHLGGTPLGARSGQDVVTVRCALRIDGAPLLVERGVVVDVRLVSVELVRVLGDQD